MINVEQIYASYLKEKNEKNREKYKEFSGTFSASSAGNCFRKQYLKGEYIFSDLDSGLWYLNNVGHYIFNKKNI